MWPQGTTYGGGGWFVTNRTLALRGVLDLPHEDFPLRGLQVVDAETPLHLSASVLSPTPTGLELITGAAPSFRAGIVDSAIRRNGYNAG